MEGGGGDGAAEPGGLSRAGSPNARLAPPLDDCENRDDDLRRFGSGALLGDDGGAEARLEMTLYIQMFLNIKSPPHDNQE